MDSRQDAKNAKFKEWLKTQQVFLGDLGVLARGPVIGPLALREIPGCGYSRNQTLTRCTKSSVCQDQPGGRGYQWRHPV